VDESISLYFIPEKVYLFHIEWKISMHIISHSRLKAFWQKHPGARSSLQGWYIRSKHARWTNFVELRQVFPSADQVGKFTIFNIGGNNYRLITVMATLVTKLSFVTRVAISGVWLTSH
jgi:mRNA interferase HigB